MEADLTLLEAARSMNQEALVAIFDLYSAPLYNYALRLCNDPLAADHVVGDVFAKFLDQLAAGKGPNTNLRSYLYQTTYHLIVDEARFSHREAPFEVIDYVQGNGHTPHAGLENRMLLDTLVIAIRNELTEDQRHVIVLRFLEGFSLRETADIIGKQVYNVKVIQNRGIAKLRKVLGYKVS
jgi:RNA polymerase sigma-70 factor (ECF subfamily)